MTIWYELTPIDTLFFRGSEAMEAGQLSRDALFPPPVSVIQGALRTAVLKQQGISFADYNNGNCSSLLIKQIGKSGEKAPFSVTALLFRKNKVDYASCPAHWFVPSITGNNGKHTTTTARMFTGRTILPARQRPEATAALSMYTSSGSSELPIVCAETDPEPLAGNWLRLALLLNRVDSLQEGDMLPPSALYDLEPRTGIELDKRRKVVSGKLYSAGHIRLRQDVSFVVGVDSDIGLAENGIFSLGGEKRSTGYMRTKGPSLPSGPGGLYLALAPVEITVELLSKVFCTVKPVTLAGWDLHSGFHKPTSTWLPAGTVFTSNINNCCVPIVY